MLESFNNKFEYTKLTPEEQKSRGILGRLVGVMADFKNPTRNGRLYNEELWDKVFEDPIMKEKISNKCCFGELGHPENRQETDMEKIAICLDGFPKKNKEGKLVGIFNILDTPNGRILKTLCDYGCNIGVSSRGTGDVDETYDGKATVIPDTYECECWDAVLIPAVEAARPQYMTESLGKKTFKTALNEELEKSNPEEKKVMLETLNGLNIDYKIADENTNNAAIDNGAEIVKSLQESLKKQEELETQVKELQEKLSVCYTKEASLEEDLQRYKASTIALSDRVKEANGLKSKNDSLTEKLSQCDSIINAQNIKIAKLDERLKSQITKQNSLNESLSTKDVRIKELQESFTSYKTDSEKKISQLEESLENVKQNSAIKSKEYVEKISKSNQLVEKYKSIAKTAIDKYIESKANMIGVSKEEIKNRLNENYSFSDIDKVCEDLRQYQLNVNDLPFKLGNKQVRMKITESKEPIRPASPFDDEIDSNLIKLANKI